LQVDRSAAPRAPSRLITPTFFVITLSTFAYFLSVGALIPTLPLFVEGPLAGGSVQVGLGVGAFSLSAVLLRPLAGRLGDARGRKLLIVSGAALVTLSVVAYVAAASLPALIAMRLVTGAGEALFYVGAASAINDLAPDERRGEAMSFFSLALYSGIALGPVLGEWVLDTSEFDVVWIVAAASSLVALVLGILVRDTRPDGTESNGNRRLIHPAGLLPGTVLATSVWGLAGFNTFVPLYAREIGLSGSRLVFVAFSVIVLSIRSLGARIPDRLGVARTARSSLAVTGAGLAIMGAVQNRAGLFVGASIFAIGQALAFPALMTLAVGSVLPSERGAVVGTFTAFFDLAFGLGAVSLGAVAALFGYPGTFVTAALIAFGGLVMLLGRDLPGPGGERVLLRRIEEGCEPL
jgi:MFS family permease